LACGRLAQAELGSPRWVSYPKQDVSTVERGDVRRHAKEVIVAGEEIYSELKNLCVWNKPNAGLGSLYRSKHELIFVFKVGKGAHINNVALGRNGRHRTNVWDYVSQNTLNGTTRSKLALHPTVKPVAMVADAIRDCSNRNAVSAVLTLQELHAGENRRVHWGSARLAALCERCGAARASA
jgi:hypothetical protein